MFFQLLLILDEHIKYITEMLIMNHPAYIDDMSDFSIPGQNPIFYVVIKGFL